jgi:hypothetical protein
MKRVVSYVGAVAFVGVDGKDDFIAIEKLRCDFGQERCIMQEWITRRATAQRAVSEVWFIRGNIGSNRESTGSWRRRIYGGRKSRWLGLIESCVERRSQWDFASSAISKVVQRNITN